VVLLFLWTGRNFKTGGRWASGVASLGKLRAWKGGEDISATASRFLDRTIGGIYLIGFRF